MLPVSVSCREKDLIHMTTECVRGWSDVDVTDEKGSSPVIAAGPSSKPSHFARSLHSLGQDKVLVILALQLPPRMQVELV